MMLTPDPWVLSSIPLKWMRLNTENILLSKNVGSVSFGTAEKINL
jgi:hypothetical protein